jgi:rhamnose utilization protein RhaD (predicted bifunctional aldolase and dehydrogenase)
MAHISNQQSELNALRELSARLGSDPLLVQASTGNTSIKIGNSLWIKASGKWLIDAEADDFLVSVNLGTAMQCFRDNTDIPETAVTWGETRPSIETTMHAVLPHEVVIHVHSVSAIAWGVREDGPEQLNLRLRGLDWKWIPYTRSGIFLAREMHAAVSSYPKTNVFILGNHGLVVCARSCHSAEELLAEVAARLTIAPRPAPEPELTLLKRAASDSDWCLPGSAEVHALATDQFSRRILSGGVLYPCQAMFLPDTAPPVSRPLNKYSGLNRPASIRLIDGGGVLCSKHVTPAQEQLLRGLAEVVQRVDRCAPVRYLTALEVLDVLNGTSYQAAAVSARSMSVCRKIDLRQKPMVASERIFSERQKE